MNEALKVRHYSEHTIIRYLKWTKDFLNLNIENLNNLNTKVVVPLTSNTINADLRGNVFLPKNESGLSKDSVALIHQIVVVDKFRLEEKISKLPKHLLSKIEEEIDYVTKE